MIGTDIGLVVGSRSVASLERGQVGERPLWPCFFLAALSDSFHNDLQQRHHRCFRSPENGDN